MPDERKPRTKRPPKPQAPARIGEFIRPMPKNFDGNFSCGGEPDFLPTFEELLELKRKRDEEEERELEEAEEKERAEKAKKKEEDEDDDKKVERFRNDRYAVKLLRQDAGSWGGGGSSAADEMDALG